MINKLKNFFFPDDTKLKIEAITQVRMQDRKLIIHREFHTFRSLAMFIRDEILSRREIREARRQGFKWGTKHWMFNSQRGAIAFDAVSSTTQTDLNTTNFTFSHTCSGVDRVLTVGVSTFSLPVSTITYNSVSMTNQVSQPSTSSAVIASVASLWYLVNPSTGSNTVSVSFSVSENGAGAGAISFTGADTTTPIDGFAGAAGATSTATVNVTTAKDASIVVDCLQVWEFTTTGSATVGSGQTSRYNNEFAFRTDVNRRGISAGSTEPKATAGTVTMDWTGVPTGANIGWAIAAMGIAQGATSAIKTFNGLANASVKTVNSLARANVKTWNGLA